MKLNNVLEEFELNTTGNYTIEPLGTGLINATWKVTIDNTNEDYVLQRINTHVFKNPMDIGYNINLLSTYFKEGYPSYLFTHPVKNHAGLNFVVKEHAYYRLFDFVPDSKTLTTLNKPEQAYEAAKQFGKFTSLLSTMDVAKLRVTIPDFHNLTLRYEQFEQSLQKGNQQRIGESFEIINIIKANAGIVKTYEAIVKDPGCKLRVTHHDTKISNVLFDDQDKGLCVIDLDTIMPGYFISDIGDMFRTYVCPISEEEKDITLIEVRAEYFEAIIKGYLEDMQQLLTKTEITYILYAAEFMIYMQAIRFLADHFNNDIYYGAKYEGHNLSRAKNQLRLLEIYVQHKPYFEEVVNRWIK